MTPNNKAALPVQASTLGITASKPLANHSTLTPRQQRILAALNSTSKDGILSYDLRQIAGCMNIADEVMELRRLGVSITCELEPFTTLDGRKSKIGRYRLEQPGG